jgi:hypothetical protein
MKPHKHAELIKAWADGAEIQIYCEDTGEWQDTITDRVGFNWYENIQYRIKPKTTTDIVILKNVKAFSVVGNGWTIGQANFEPNIKFVFDEETGELKSAEVLK